MGKIKAYLALRRQAFTHIISYYIIRNGNIYEPNQAFPAVFRPDLHVVSYPHNCEVYG